jgi:hypothetical protein
VEDIVKESGTGFVVDDHGAGSRRDPRTPWPHDLALPYSHDH